MNEKALAEYFLNLNKGEKRLQTAIIAIKKYEAYLVKLGKTADDATPENLVNFLADYTTWYTSGYDLRSLRYYYAATDNQIMLDAVAEMKYRFTPPVKLSEFLDIDPENIEILKKRKIRTNNELLRVCDSPEKREALAVETQIPLEVIVKLTKLSDLARIFAVKGIRAKLYVDSGVDTIEKMAQWDPVALREMLVQYVERTGFPGIATLPKEAEFTVEFAKRLSIIVKV